MTQFYSRSEELENRNARIVQYLLEDIEGRFAARSSKFRMTNSSGKRPPKCGGTEKSTSTLSTANRLRMEVKLAKVRLQQVRREQELEAKQKQIQAKKMIFQAETAVLEAQPQAEAIEEQILEQPVGVDPVISPHS